MGVIPKASLVFARIFFPSKAIPNPVIVSLDDISYINICIRAIRKKER
jgi:hypothetical protein